MSVFDGIEKAETPAIASQHIELSFDFTSGAADASIAPSKKAVAFEFATEADIAAGCRAVVTAVLLAVSADFPKTSNATNSGSAAA